MNHLIGMSGAVCGAHPKQKWNKYNPQLPKCPDCLIWLKALSWAEVEKKEKP